MTKAKKAPKIPKGVIRADILRYYVDSVREPEFSGCYEESEAFNIELPDDSDEAERQFEADFDATGKWFRQQLDSLKVP